MFIQIFFAGDTPTNRRDLQNLKMITITNIVVQKTKNPIIPIKQEINIKIKQDEFLKGRAPFHIIRVKSNITLSLSNLIPISGTQLGDNFRYTQLSVNWVSKKFSGNSEGIC